MNNKCPNLCVYLRWVNIPPASICRVTHLPSPSLYEHHLISQCCTGSSFTFTHRQHFIQNADALIVLYSACCSFARIKILNTKRSNYKPRKTFINSNGVKCNLVLHHYDTAYLISRNKSSIFTNTNRVHKPRTCIHTIIKASFESGAWHLGWCCLIPISASVLTVMNSSLSPGAQKKIFTHAYLLVYLYLNSVKRCNATLLLTKNEEDYEPTIVLDIFFLFFFYLVLLR